MAKIKLDLHDIFNNGRAIEDELNRVVRDVIENRVSRDTILIYLNNW